MGVKDFIKNKEAQYEAKRKEAERKRIAEEEAAANFDFAAVLGEKNRKSNISREGIVSLILIPVSIIVGFVSKRPEYGLGILLVGGLLIQSVKMLARFLGRKL